MNLFVFQLVSEIQRVLALGFGPGIVVGLNILYRVIEALLHSRDILFSVIVHDQQHNGQDHQHQENGDGDHQNLADLPFPVRVNKNLVEEDGGEGVFLQALRLAGQEHFLHRVHNRLGLVRGLRKYVLQLALIYVFPDASGIEGNSVGVGQLEFFGYVGGEPLFLAQVAEKVMTLLVLGQLILLQFLLPDHIHAQGAVLALHPQEAVPVEPEPGVTRLSITQLHIVCNQYCYGGLQLHLAAGREQGAVGGPQVPAHSPFAHGRGFHKRRNNGIHCQFGADGVHIVVNAVRNDIAGELIKFYKTEEIGVLDFPAGL